MPTQPHAVDVPGGTTLYRITSTTFLTANVALHRKVVDGQGAVRSPYGARWNYAGAITVYLTEDIETCLAERMFYFHREYLQALDNLHLSYSGGTFAPHFQRRFVIWRIELTTTITDVAELDMSSAGFFGVFPSMMENPSQDYRHLKERRAHIQPQGYSGIRAPSARTTNGGRMVVLFSDQSSNVQSIVAMIADFRLLQPNGQPFSNHTSHLLDFASGEVRITPPSPRVSVPLWAGAYRNWTRILFNH